MTEYFLPLTNDPRQVMILDLTIDGEGFHARIEVRYLPAPGCWVISVWDEAAGELLINQIPLICSYGFRVIGSPVILQQSEKRICFN